MEQVDPASVLLIKLDQSDMENTSSCLINLIKEFKALAMLPQEIPINTS